MRSRKKRWKKRWGEKEEERTNSDDDGDEENHELPESSGSSKSGEEVEEKDGTAGWTSRSGLRWSPTLHKTLRYNLAATVLILGPIWGGQVGSCVDAVGKVEPLSPSVLLPGPRHLRR